MHNKISSEESSRINENNRLSVLDPSQKKDKLKQYSLAKLLELKDNMPFCTYKEEARWLLENGVKNLYAEQVKTEIKHEAYKEFAEKLKNEIINDTAYACDSTQHSGYYDYQIKIGDIPEYIDNLLKELVGEDK